MKKIVLFSVILGVAGFDALAGGNESRAAMVQGEPSKTSLTVNIEQAILMAMENNRSLVVEKMNPGIQSTFEKEQRSIFDPVLGGDITDRRTVAERQSRAGSSTENQIADTITGNISLDKYFSSGTNVSLDGSSSYTDSSLYSDTFVSNRLGITVTQALLQGADIRANMASIRQANLDTIISEYELRGFSEVLLDEVEQAFWDYALARKQIEIYTKSLDLAQKQMNEIEEKIKIGTLAETELAAAKAEYALRSENLINARSSLSISRLRLLRLLNPSKEINWNMEINLQYQAALPEITLDDIEPHVQVALKMRPDLNEARLRIRRGELEVVKTKNGLLPKLDAFITYGKSGYSNSFHDALSNMDEDRYDAAFGLTFQYPVSNQAAQARYTRSVLNKEQMLKSLDNLVQLVQVDVRSAYIEVTRTREQISATTATRILQEEKLRVENEKFNVGRSTSLLVAQAQRDLVESQIAEIRATVNYLKAMVSLYDSEGSLLQRRGISAPGSQTVTLDK